MIKRSFKTAIFLSLGAIVGGKILPRLMSPIVYNETMKETITTICLSFIISLFVSFSILLLIEWVLLKVKDNVRS